MASELVRTVAAFKAAFHYISTGIQLLPENSWQDHYDLTLELYSAAAEVSLVNGDLAQADKLAIITETNSHTLLEKVRIMNIRMDVYVLRNQIHLVIELGVAGIHLLDFDLEVDPPQIRSVEQMNRLSEMTDARALAVCRMIEALISAAFARSAEWLTTFIHFYLDLFARYGNHPGTSFIFIAYLMSPRSVAIHEIG